MQCDNNMITALQFLACAAAAAAVVPAATGAGNLHTVNEWSMLRYDVPFNYPNADSYKPEVTVPTGIEIGERNLVTYRGENKNEIN